MNNLLNLSEYFVGLLKYFNFAKDISFIKDFNKLSQRRLNTTNYETNSLQHARDKHSNFHKPLST